MSQVKLRKVGGSVMLAVPPAVLEELHAGVETVMNVSVSGGKLVAAPKRRRRYTLEQLIARCDPKAPLEKDRSWVKDGRAGRERI